MARTFLIEKAGNNPAGPFGLRELEGQFLRGDIEPGTKVCEVGAKEWIAVKDVFQNATDTKRKQLHGFAIVLLIVGVILVGMAIATKKSHQFQTPLETRLAEVDQTVEATKNRLVGDKFKKDYLNESVGSSEFASGVGDIYRAASEASSENKAKIVELYAQEEDRVSKRRLVFGVSGIIPAFIGGLLLLKVRKLNPITRPPKPSESPKDTPQAIAKPLPAPVFPPKPPEPAKPKEPKGICENCGTHIAFPREMEGHHIDCPSCGKSTVLADASDVL